MAELDDIKKQISDLNKRIGELGGSFKTNIDSYISSFGNDITAANKALSEMQKIFSNLDTDVNYFYRTIQNVGKELKGQSNYNKDIAKSYSAIASITNKLKYDQDGIQTLSKKELQNLQKKVKIQQTDLTDFLTRNIQAEKESESRIENYNKKLNEAYILNKKREITDKNLKDIQKNVGELLKGEKVTLENIKNVNKEVDGLLNDQEFGIRKLNSIIKERLEEEIKIQKTLGISGKIIDSIVSALGKLSIDSSFFEGVKEDMREAAKTGNSWKVLMTGIKGLASGIGEALKDPVSQLYILYNIAKFFVKAALTANSQIVELGKSLGYAADGYRSQLVRIERSSNSIFVTTKNLTEAYGELVKTIGFAYEFSADQLETQIKLTKQVGLQANEAAQIQRYSVLTGQSSESTYKSFVKGLVAARNQLKVGIDFRAALAEAANLSGQLAANLGFNPERIAQAVVTAKALGLTFDQLKSATSSLLDFGSSIENELKAELLTGKQLNLERARAAALQGDQVALAEELAKNIGTAADFTKLNVLQQDALSKTMGMTSDQLAETLRRREEAIASGKSLQQITDEEAQKALERTSIQDKFNAAVEKLQSLFGNLMAGPLGSFIDVLSGALNIINYMATPIKIIGGLFLGIYGTMLAINGIGKAIAITEGLSATLMSRKAGFAAVDLGYQVSKNALAAIELSTEGGKLSFKTLSSALEKESLLTRTIAYGLALKDLIVERSKALFSKAGLLSLIGQIAKYPVMLALKGTEAAISATTAAAAVATASAATLGIGTVAIIAGIAAVMGALGTYMAMKDGVIDPSKGPVMTGGFGSVQLDPNDKAMYGADGKIKVGTDLLGTNLNKPSINAPKSPLFNASALAKSIDSMHNTLKQYSSRPSIAYINGEDAFTRRLGSNPYLGTSQNMDTAYQMA